MPSLTALFVERVRGPGKYYDKYGLYLHVASSGYRYWEQRYTPREARHRTPANSPRARYKDFRRTIGIGPYPTVSLAAARAKALENLRLVAEGKDPVELRREKPVPTLRAAVRQVIELHRVPSTSRSWTRTKMHGHQPVKVMARRCRTRTKAGHGHGHNLPRLDDFESPRGTMERAVPKR